MTESDAEHTAVFGATRGGKSTFMREVQARADGIGVYMTTKSNERTAQSDPPHRIRESSCNYSEDIPQVRDWAKEKSEKVTICVDECQNAPTFENQEKAALYHALKEDAGSNIKWVLGTQNPKTLKGPDGYDSVQNCEYWVWCGAAKDWDMSFFSSNNLGHIRDKLPTADYEYAVIDTRANIPADEKIVSRGETDPNFG
jgi:hypothetical protein